MKFKITNNNINKIQMIKTKLYIYYLLKKREKIYGSVI